jgi:mitochondrial fission protein ELM1
VLATTSRRTPAAFAASLRDRLAALPCAFWDGGGTNPYPGLLAWADRIVVTPDSVNMLSEACATGVPVHAPTSMPLPAKLARFHAALRERGLLTEPGAVRGDVPPLREAQAVAAELRERMTARAPSP